MYRTGLQQIIVGLKDILILPNISANARKFQKNDFLFGRYFYFIWYQRRWYAISKVESNLVSKQRYPKKNIRSNNERSLCYGASVSYRRRVVGGTRGPMTSPCHASAATCSAINISLALLSGRNNEGIHGGEKNALSNEHGNAIVLLPHINIMAAIRTAHFGRRSSASRPLWVMLRCTASTSLCSQYDRD